jgi:hypothetical protein
MIQNCEFGKFVINKITYESDIKIINDQVIPWNTRRGHDLLLVDLRDLFRGNPKFIIVGTGYSGKLKVSPEVRNFLSNQKIELIEKSTKEACDFINALAYRKEKIYAILHSTC